MYEEISVTEDYTLSERSIIKEWAQKAKQRNAKEPSDSNIVWRVILAEIWSIVLAKLSFNYFKSFLLKYLKFCSLKIHIIIYLILVIISLKNTF